MLKNPQFSTKHNENKSKATMKKQTRAHKNIDVGSEVRATKKENQKNKKGQSKKGPAKKGQFRSTVPLMASQDIRVQKAQSSLASSNYHASGYLPQHDCSEDPFTSLASQAYDRINQGVGTEASTPKSGMPQNTGRYTKTQELPEERDPRQYDGAGDLHYKSTTSEYEDASSACSSDREVRKRVTIDDFNIYRRQFLPGAKLAIDRFFRELRDKECEMIKKSQCAKPETC